MTQTTTDACAICHSKFTKSATNLAIYDCGHTFHLSCVLKNAKLYNSSCRDVDILFSTVKLKTTLSFVPFKRNERYTLLKFGKV